MASIIVEKTAGEFIGPICRQAAGLDSKMKVCTIIQAVLYKRKRNSRRVTPNDRHCIKKKTPMRQPPINVCRDNQKERKNMLIC
jgi:hypothetical protein